MSILKAVDPNKAVRIYRAAEYPKQVWYFLGSFIGLLMLVYLIKRLILWRRKRSPSFGSLSSSEKEETPTRSSTNASLSLRRIPLAAVNTIRIVLFRFTLPIGDGNTLNVAEIAIISGYIVVLFTWEFVNCMNITTGVKLDAQYWSNRAADIAIAQFPLLVLLAGKNNLISLITGISFDKLNVLHRAAARTCFVLIVVHSAGRAKLGLTADTSLSEPWIQVGIAVVAAYVILVLLGARQFRMRYYEIFFVSHLVFVLFIVIGTYYHTKLSSGYAGSIIPAFVFWGLDRALRLARVVWNRRSIKSSTLDKNLPLTAIAELLSPSMVRVSMKCNMSWKAGQVVFISMPTVSAMPHEAHPFTMCNIPGNRSLANNMEISKSEENTHSIERPAGEPSDLVFFVKVKNGFTKRLHDAVQQKRDANGKASFSIRLDGPYGNPPNVNGYENVILIAGGTGITFSLPLLQDIILNVKAGRSACKTVLFIWTIPLAEHFSWISGALQEALQTAPSSLQIRIHLHATQSSTSTKPSGTNSPSEEDYESEEPYTPTDLPKRNWLEEERIHIMNKRPNIRSTLEEEILINATGTVSVNVAGPASLTEDVRQALRFNVAGPRAILRGRPSVNLHVETFGLAVRSSSELPDNWSNISAQ